MLDYEYLTEHKKNLFGYTEDIPQENEPYYIQWDDTEIQDIELLNDIFNLLEVNNG